MSEQQIREFGMRARGQVSLVDWEELEGRAGRRTRRQRVLVAAAAACVVGVTGYLANTDRVPSVDLPARQPDHNVSQDGSHGAGTYPFPDSLATESLPLPAGAYDLLISYEPFAPMARFTVPAGWLAGDHPYRGADGAQAIFAVFAPEAVTTTPCRVLATGMTPLDGDPASVTAALAAVPGERVVLAPEPDRRFGLPVTHLRLQETAAAHCPNGDYHMFKAAAAGYVSATGRPGMTVDFWVGSSGGYPFVVVAATQPGTPTGVRQELLGIVDSVQFVVE